MLEPPKEFHPVVEAKRCRECGGMFHRSLRETMGRYLKRIYCGNDCVEDYKERRKRGEKHKDQMVVLSIEHKVDAP